MNPESFGNPEPRNTEKTDWDTLGDEVAFNERIEEPDSDEAVPEKSERTKEEEDREYLGYVFEAVYSKGLESIIRNCCFEGTEDERGLRDAYVISGALGEFLSDEEQMDMIDRYADGKPVSEELREKFKNGIIDLAIDTNMTEEISKDIFLRKKHAEDIAGYTNRNDRKLQNLQTIIFNADDFFYESEEAKGLLSDEKFIRKKYRIDKLVERNKQYNPNETEEQLASEYIEGISLCVTNLVEDGIATIEEVVDDPYFRRDHFDVLYKMETEGVEVKTELAEIWRLDFDFHESYEYGDLLYQYARRNPDIYKNVDEAEIEEVVTSAIEKVSDKQIAEIVKAYEKNPRKGDALIAKILIPILGLKDNPPTLKYGEAKGKEGGFYQRSEHSVTICEGNLGEKPENDNDRILERTSSFLGFGHKKLEDNMFFRMGAVAHEFWHARQWGGTDIPEKKKEKYRKNFVYYMRGESSYGAYRNQLIEAEAWAFGERMEKRCHDMYDKIRGGKK